MVRFSWLALLALLASFVVFGCTATYEDDVESGGAESSTDAGEEGDTDSASADTDMALASNVYQDEDGVAICPVMGNQIPDVSLATGMQEYEDKVYYFC